MSNEWIPVGRKNPEHGDTVWVYDGKDVFMGEWWGQSGFQSYGSSCDREGLNSETLFDITHWMEIAEPEPPKCAIGHGGKMLEPIKDRAISDDEIDRMDVARHLLPPPGDEVAGQLIAEVRRLRLTDAEREAVERAASVLGDHPLEEDNEMAATLRNLLERIGGER